MSLIFDQIPEFEKDMKKLLKSLQTLEEDLNLFKQFALNAYHIHGLNNWWFFPIGWIGIEDSRYSFIKVKKFTCKSLKGKWVHSWIRIIYCYDNETSKVIFIEIYYKEKNNTECDHKRIHDFYTTIKK